MARPRLVSDEDIITAVRRGVFQQGPGVSLDVVAGSLGITSPALFKRFGSRKALLMAALKPPEKPPFLDLLEHGPDQRPFETQLSQVVEAILGFLHDQYPCMTALRESSLTSADLKRLYKDPPGLRAVRAIEAWLKRAQEQGLATIADPKVSAMAILGACHMPVMLSHLGRIHSGAHTLSPGDVRPYAKSITQIFSHGLHLRKRT
jgi:AcrR family transcriptional regulator